MKMDIRVGKIIAAEKVAKTKKLMKLTVDTGIDERTIVSGIAEHYTPEEVIGRQVSVLVNLEPKPLKGIVSEEWDPDGQECRRNAFSLFRRIKRVKPDRSSITTICRDQPDRIITGCNEWY